MIGLKQSVTGRRTGSQIEAMERRQLLSAAVQTYLTDYPKTDNIYTDLNEQFPHSGTGVPGSGVGTANASFLFDPSPAAVAAAGYAPNYVAGSNTVNNGIDFSIVSDSTGHDFDEINSGQVTVVPAHLNGVQTVYVLLAAYDGTGVNVTFAGADGQAQSFSGVSVPDFNGGSINTTGTGYTDQTVFQVNDVGAGGTGNSTTGDTTNYGLTEVAFTMPAGITAEELSTISFTSSGYDTLLLGVTASSTGATGNTVYSAAADFSPNANANGVWSYGDRTTESSDFAAYTQNSALDIGFPAVGWDGLNGSSPPYVGENFSASTYDGSTVALPAGVLDLHPGPEGEYTDVRFIAPSSGTYTVDSTFTGIDTSGTTTDVHILQNGVSIADGNIDGFGSTFTKNTSVTLSAGDTIDFIVGYGNGNYSNDSTSLSATLTPGTTPTLTPVTNFNATADIQSNLVAQVPTGTFTTTNSFATPFDIPAGQNLGQAALVTVTANVNLSNVTGVYTLINGYAPQPGEDIGTLTFNYADGTSVAENLIGGVNVRDFRMGDYANTLSAANAENAFAFTDVQGGAGTGDVTTGLVSNYVVDEQYWALTDSSSLVSVQLTTTSSNQVDGSGSGSGTPILLGLTVAHEGGTTLSPAKSIGGLDPGFGSNGLASHDVGFNSTNGVAVDGANSILVGPIGAVGGESFGVTRYLADGSLDTSFGSGGVTSTSFGDAIDAVPTSVQVLSGGNILVAGTASTYTAGVITDSKFAAVEYNPDGSINTSFGTDGQVLVRFSNITGVLSNDVLRAVAVGADGTIYLGGSTDVAGLGNTDFAVAALTSSGTLDTAFNSSGTSIIDIAGGDDQINALAVQSNGDVVAAGSAAVNGVSEVALARLLPSGNLDKKFGDKGLVTDGVGGVYDTASSVVVQPKGQILIGGLTASGSGDSLSSDFLLQRYTATGRLDHSFGGGTITTSFGQPAAVTQLALQADGSVVASGKTSSVLGGTLDVAVARYTAKGALDSSFGSGGKVVIDLGSGIVPAAASSLGAAFDAFVSSEQGTVGITQGGEILAAGSSGVNTVEAELIAAGVDLVANVLSTLPASVLGGSKGKLTVTITESGTTAAKGAVTIELSFAVDAAGDGATTPSGYGERISLKQGQTKPFKLVFTYPSGVSGGYFATATVTNGAGVAADLNEDNNTAAAASATTIAPAFVALGGSGLSAGAFTAGKPATITVDITNTGNVTAKGKTEIDFYLSTDGTIADGTPLPVAPLTVSLPAGKSKVYRLKVLVPTAIPAGTFNLLGVIDPNNSLGSGDASDTLVVDAVPVVVS